MAPIPPDQKKARALKMLEAKLLEGKSTAEIAQQFGVSPDTVYKAMSLAKKAEVVVQFEDKLVNELLPLAHLAVLGALQDGNAKVGLAILQGTQVLRPNQQRTQRQYAEDDELARHINRKRAQAALQESTVDGQLTEVPRLEASIEGERPGDHVLSLGSLEAESQGAAEDRPGSPESPGTDACADSEPGA